MKNRQELIKAQKIQSCWYLFLQWVQEALQKLNLQRVETPTIVSCPGTEPELEVFEIQQNRKTKYLITSPEMHLKRLLCRGWTDIYEIAKCFRKNETGPFNHSEFYMLEWYRAYASLDSLMKDLEFLLNFLLKKFIQKQKNKTCRTAYPKAYTYTLKTNSKIGIRLKKISMHKLFKKHLDMDLQPHNVKEDFMKQLKKRQIPFSVDQDISSLFYLLFLNYIEPALNKDIPLIIYDYPPFQKAYARLDNKGWAKRFEFFWKGMELANAFDEVTDKEEQYKRFKEDLAARKKNKKQAVQMDAGLLKDMEKGSMPPASGISVGLERLFMTFTNLQDIKELKLFRS